MNDIFKLLSKGGFLPTYYKTCSACNKRVDQGESYRIMSKEPVEKVWCMGCVKLLESRKGE